MGTDLKGQVPEASRRLMVSRRGFLRGASAVAGAAALYGLTGARVASAAEDFPHYPNRFGMLTDTTKCIGCRMCENACAKANNNPAPVAGQAVFEETRRPSADALTVVNRCGALGDGKPVYRKVQCMHCDEPACVSACLVKALKKTPEGPVIYDENLCIGCRYCMVACPFNSLSYQYDDPLTPKVVKCVMCYERTVKEGGSPACAEACPVGCTTFGKREELVEIAHERIAQEPDKYVDHVYGEHEAGGTSWLYLASVPFEQLGFPTNVGRTPYPELTRDFLLAVPVAYVMMPPMLAGLQAIMKRREELAAKPDADGKRKEEER